MTKVYTGICPLQIVVEDITNISQSVLEDLDVGDIVAKLTNGDKHCYRVSYKKKGVGMCLTYADASRVETISYDCIDGVWTYNSTDVSELGGSSGTKLYRHEIKINGSIDVLIISAKQTQYEGNTTIELVYANDKIITMSYGYKLITSLITGRKVEATDYAGEYITLADAYTSFVDVVTEL